MCMSLTLSFSRRRQPRLVGPSRDSAECRVREWLTLISLGIQPSLKVPYIVQRFVGMTMNVMRGNHLIIYPGCWFVWATSTCCGATHPGIPVLLAVTSSMVLRMFAAADSESTFAMFERRWSCNVTNAIYLGLSDNELVIEFNLWVWLLVTVGSFYSTYTLVKYM